MGHIIEGTVFAPFHYSRWDPDGAADADRRAANELAMTVWDPVSKQPYFAPTCSRTTAPAPIAARPARLDDGDV